MLQNKSKHKITLSLARKGFDYLHFLMKKLQKSWSLKAWLVPNWNVASKQVCPSNLILTGISLSWFVPSLVTGRECRVLGIADGAILDRGDFVCSRNWILHVSQMMGKSLPMKVRLWKESENSTKHTTNKGQFLAVFSSVFFLPLNLGTCWKHIIALSDEYLWSIQSRIPKMSSKVKMGNIRISYESQ